MKLRGMYGAFAEHTIFYLVEADTAEGVQRFLDPGFKQCEVTVTPVSDMPISR